VTRVALDELLGTPVRLLLGDVRVGTVTGVYGSEGFGRAIGLEVAGPDGRRRFLPWVASVFDGDVVRVRSALLLVETGGRDSYMQLGALLARDPRDLEGLAASSTGRVEHGVSLEAASGTPRT
jgi:hypothetical protein